MKQVLKINVGLRKHKTVKTKLKENTTTNN
jgi:hypothetical protein